MRVVFCRNYLIKLININIYAIFSTNAKIITFIIVELIFTVIMTYFCVSCPGHTIDVYLVPQNSNPRRIEISV